MACRYIYKGHEFANVNELDDFILEKLPFMTKFKDAVFELSASQMSKITTLDLIVADSKVLREDYLNILNSDEGKVSYGEDGEVSVEKPPYIGVNKYLSGKTTIDGDLMFPEFIRENYWAIRRSHWKLGEYTPEEIEEFGIDPKNPEKLTDEKLMKDYEVQMENRWKQQAKIGTAFHNLLLLCFDKTPKGYMVTMQKQAIKNHIWKAMDASTHKYVPSDEFGDKIIDSAIDYAKHLHNELRGLYGDDLVFYPEFMITQDTNEISGEEPSHLMGMIDLLVVDKKGHVHIIDYKTSVHGYPEFNSAKKMSYNYQLTTYLRMLNKSGIDTYLGGVYIAPIKIDGFQKSEDGSGYVYSGITPPNLLQQIDTYLNIKMWEHIDQYMALPFKVELTMEDVVSTVRDTMGEWEPMYNSTRTVTRDDIIEMVKKYDKLKPDENGMYSWRKYNSRGIITAESESEFIDKIFQYESTLPRQRQEMTGDVKNAIKLAMNEDLTVDDVLFPLPIITETQGSTTLLKDIVSKYCNGLWEIVDNNLLETYGIILFKTKLGVEPPLIEVLRVSDRRLLGNHRSGIGKDSPYAYMKERRGLTGKYETDINQQSKSNSLMLEAVNGNIELIETMVILNQIPSLSGHMIGRIQVVNPKYANGLRVSNEELLYCWRELNLYHKIKGVDHFLNGDIKLATFFDIAHADLYHLVSEAELADYLKGYRNFDKLKTSVTILDSTIDGTRLEKLEKLMLLYKEILNVTAKPGDVSELDKAPYTVESDLLRKEVRLHNEVLMAIAELLGVNFRQQLRDHDKFILKNQMNLNPLNFTGVSGTYTDNPGNMDSDTLNLVTRLVTEAYQNTRDHMLREKITINKLVENLKKESNFGYLELSTIGNQAELYKDMVEFTEDGDFLFKDPDRLQGAAKEFLEYVLYTVNKNRYPTLTDEDLQRKRNSGDLGYYRVPIALGDLDSKLSVDGLMVTLKGKLRNLDPRIAYEKAKRWITGKANEIDNDDLKLSEILFQMSNTFDLGEGKDRLDMIKRLGEARLEHNLEALIYKHIFAYSVKDSIDNIFPMVKAAMVHLATLGSILNNPFTEDLHYFKNYITNKIFNKSIKDPKFKELNKILGALRSTTAKFILAFSPVQALYQPLQLIWWDVSLMIRKPDGGKAFKPEYFAKAFKIAYSDLFHFSNKPTLCSAFNELYALNDMDMNSYNERIGNYKAGVFNFENICMRCATRPDFYGRSAMFLCQMMGDGCLEAHHLTEDGRLVYDWKKDKRFEAFANGWVSDPRYNEQKSLYYMVGKQFEIEHTKNPDGTDFKLDMKNPKALPRAYTTKLAEAYKSLMDDVYGYYSHEKKSMIMATTIGSMWMQFKTYWSGKKNQYLQPGGVRFRGDWQQVEMAVRDENGNVQMKKMFYTVNPETGEPDYYGKLTDEDTGFPAIQWKGQWQEGIFVTLSSLIKDTVNGRWKDAWDEKWNNSDFNLQTAYRNNLKQLGFDTFMFIIVGSFVSALMTGLMEKLKEKNKNDKTLANSFAISAANIAATSVQHSLIDFNVYETVGGPLASWQPLSFTWAPKKASRLLKAAFDDDKSFYDAVISTPSSTRYFLPVFDYIKPDAFKTQKEREREH